MTSTSPLGARLLVGPYNTLIGRRWGLCSVEPSQTAGAPEGLWPGWAGSLGCGLSRPSRAAQSRGPRQRGLAPFLSLAGNLAALEQRVEGGGPEAGLASQRVGLVRRGGLAVETEGGADQTVVAAPVVAAVAVEARAGAGRDAGRARRPPSDAGGTGFASGHPGQDHVDQRPQEEAHGHGHTEGYDQGDDIKGLKYFQKEVCVVFSHNFLCFVREVEGRILRIHSLPDSLSVLPLFLSIPLFSSFSSLTHLLFSPCVC